MHRLAARVRGHAGFGSGIAGAGAGAAVNPILALSPAAYFRFNTGITVTGAGVSQWADQSGNGRHLLQGTDTNRPALQGDGSILFDGVDNYLKCGAFTLNQPTTVYARFKQITWAADDSVFDGDTNVTGLLYQFTASPQLLLHAGTSGAAANSNMTIDTYFSVCAIFNGASSSLKVGASAETTGNPGAGNMGGFTLGARGGIAFFSNIQVKEVAIFASAHNSATRDSVIAYLNTL